MALLRKLFFRKPPDGLLEISERVYAPSPLQAQPSFLIHHPKGMNNPSKRTVLSQFGWEVWSVTWY
ncbi:hypothetical protein I3842_15G154700 [Carya illinoinensis]|uniref:Uncharacterized protein n=1 Tax=Carya illinoinensis TaxID=32201 RepID=A0A922A9L0_CARIL|nr:hypothetical protein I3842_15G154700 [Carya illinoinensis]